MYDREKLITEIATKLSHCPSGYGLENNANCRKEPYISCLECRTQALDKILIPEGYTELMEAAKEAFEDMKNKQTQIATLEKLSKAIAKAEGRIP